MAGRAWTTSDDATIRARFRKGPTLAIAKDLGRTKSAVFQRARTLGLAIPRRLITPEFIAFLKEKNAAGWSDTEIGKASGADRHAIRHLRHQLGLPMQRFSDHGRGLVRAKTSEQLKSIGLKNLGELRAKVYADRARAAGWPEDLRPRAVEILNLLWDNGPMSRRALCDAMGLTWRGTRNSLKSNDAEGTYLANLSKRGLVVNLGRVIRGVGKGHSSCLYSLPLWIVRKAG